MPVRRWHELTSADFVDGALAQAVAVLPAGAVEQHGPHLPLGTDLLIANALVERAAALVPDGLTVLVIPESAIGYSTEHGNFPGTLSLSSAALAAVWIETGESLARAGVRRLLSANAHGGNVPVMDIVARELRARFGMLVAGLSWFDFDLPAGVAGLDEAAHDIHGGRLETSMMLYLHANLVRMDKAADFTSATRSMARDRPALFARGAAGFGWLAEDLNPAGAMGNAAAADGVTGQRIVEHASAAFAAAIGDLAGLAAPA